MGVLKDKNGVSYLLPFILVTCCFALWGFANDITNPMVKSFSKIFPTGRWCRWHSTGAISAWPCLRRCSSGGSHTSVAS